MLKYLLKAVYKSPRFKGEKHSNNKNDLSSNHFIKRFDDKSYFLAHIIYILLYTKDQREFGHGVSIIAHATNFMPISSNHALQLSQKRNLT